MGIPVLKVWGCKDIVYFTAESLDLSLLVLSGLSAQAQIATDTVVDSAVLVLGVSVLDLSSIRL